MHDEEPSSMLVPGQTLWPYCCIRCGRLLSEVGSSAVVVWGDIVGYICLICQTPEELIGSMVDTVLMFAPEVSAKDLFRFSGLLNTAI
jgi:DNA-directed RNA polymerase subunit RPC12/RpoP